MRTRSIVAAFGGVAMFVALLPNAAGAQVDGARPDRAPRASETPVAPPSERDGRPTAPPADARQSVPDDASRQAEPDPENVVVKFRDDVVRPSSVDGEPVRDVPESGYSLVEVPEDKSADEVAAELEERSDVEFAEPDRQVTAFESPGQTGEFDRIGVKDAWKRAKGSSDVVVAVVDSGIDQDHPDFTGRLVTGYDFVDPGTYPHDSDGHGTSTAGVIAARHGAGTTIDGVAGGGTKIMPLRVLNGGSGPLSSVAAAIRYAADHGADIVNLSLGAEGRSIAVDNAVAYAADRGLLVIASTGNDEAFLSNTPANSPRVIGVSATDDNGDTAAFTTYGPDVDLAAPGVAINTTANGGGSTTVNGTSFSAPMVAGVAALLKDRHPGWSGDRIATELLLTAEDRGPVGIDDFYGYGIVDAAAALGVSGRAPFVGVAPAAVDSEPNDVSSRATATTTNNTGSITPEGDVDWWKFDSAGGEDVTITVTPSGSAPGPEFDPVVRIHGPDEELVIHLDEWIGDTPESTTITTVEGEYKLSIENYFGTVSPGGYQLSVVKTPSVASPTETEGGKPWLEATTPTARRSGVSRTANLTVRTGRTMKGSSVNGNTVVLIDGIYGGAVQASVTFNGNDTITVNPTGSLDPGRPYALILAGVQDVASNYAPWTMIPFSTTGSFVQPNISGVYEPIVGDFSGDGASDVLFYGPGTAADFLQLGDWSGLFDLGAFPINGQYEPFTLDLDGNGHDDIIFYAPGTTQDYIWLFDEAGYYSVPTKASGIYEPFTLDLNGDGFDDILWYAPGPAQDYIWYGKAGGGHTSVPTKASGDYEPFVGDFNDDGFDDIFWYAPGTANDYRWYGKANGFTSVPTTVNGTYRPIAGDFDGDGYGDVLFYAPGAAPDFQWLFRAGGYDSVQVSISGTYTPLGGDFNGDRFDDVFFYGVGTRSDSLLLGGTDGLFG
ncbi:S8 family serine peptidase [Actinospongicola halichondriae]|uniref:S8 family serine peptidase n=1 Tax=Actinospongicola halichondriae TaxID=3236844 RepID=UPI003D38CB3E